MKKITYPITAENFSEAWNYTNKKLVEIKKKGVIRDFLKVFTNITFLFSLTLLTYGVLMTFGNKFIIKFLDSFTILKTMWNMTMLSQPNLHIGLKFAIYLGILIIPSLIVSTITTLIVWFSYKPNKKEMTGNNEEDSRELLALAKELNLRCENQKGLFSFYGLFFYFIELICIVFLYGIYFLKENDIVLFKTFVDMAMIYLKPYLFMVVWMILGISLVICLLYMIINAIHNIFLKPFYKTKVLTNLKSALEVYFYECNPLEKENKDKETSILQESRMIDRKKQKDLTEEELEIQKKANEIREKRNAEREDFSKKIKNRTPIYKIIKTMATITPITIMIFLTIYFFNMSTMDFYNIFGIVYVTDKTTNEELEVLKNNESNIGFISSIEEFQKLTPEQQELLLQIGQLDLNNPEEVESFLKETGLYDIVYYEDTNRTPTLSEAMENEAAALEQMIEEKEKEKNSN